MTREELAGLYRQYLGRDPDEGAYATWLGQDANTVINGILGSQEYANLHASSSNNTPAPSNNGVDINALYQQYLGRNADAGGLATYAGWSADDIINAILGSQEYANRGGTPAASTPPTSSNSSQDYNFAMTGKPSDQELATNPDMANAWYAFSGTSPAAPSTTPPSWLNPADYVANGYAAPYTQQQVTNKVDPSWIRQMNGQTYASIKGPSDLSGGEYLVDPNTGRFVTDASGKPVGVTYAKPNGFDDWVTTPQGGLTMMALLAAGGMGINALAGAGALGGAGGALETTGAGGLAGGGAFTPAAGSGASFTLPELGAATAAGGAAVGGTAAGTAAGTASSVFGGLTAAELAKYGLTAAGIAGATGLLASKSTASTGDGGAAALEAARQKRITDATNAINTIFNGSNRAALYNNQRSAIYNLNANEVNRQAVIAERNNRFGLARNGLMGGSADIDSNNEINRKTNAGLLQAAGIADQSVADLVAADEKTRANLISMAQTGVDTGSATSMALNGLNANLNQAAAQRGGATIGGLFNDLSQAYLYNQQQQGNLMGAAYGRQNYGNSTRTGGDQGKSTNS